MSDNSATQISMTEQRSPSLSAGTCSVHIRDVPIATWRRARQNALLSGMKFKSYVTKLLAEGAVFPPAS